MCLKQRIKIEYRLKKRSTAINGGAVFDDLMNDYFDSRAGGGFKIQTTTDIPREEVGLW